MSAGEREVPGRARLAARRELAKILTDPASTGVVLSGPIGCEKSSLVDRVLRGEKLEAVRLLCSAVLGESNFGTLSPLLVDFTEPLNEAGVLKHVWSLLRSPKPGGKTIVVVEEAEHLDEASAFVLTQLASAGCIKLILMTVGQGHSERVVAGSELGARLARIILGRFSDRDVADYCQEELGRLPTTASARVIAAVCGGNGMLVGAFLRSAKQQEILVESRGRYVLEQSRINLDVHLADAVIRIQQRLDTAAATALEILALGGAEEVTLLAKYTGADVGRLVDAGLVRQVAESRVEIAAPIHAQILRDLIPPGRNLQLMERVIQRSVDHGSLPESVLWACENGRHLETRLVLEATTLANNQLDFPTAWRLCQHSNVLGGRPAFAREEVRALMGMRRYQEVMDTVGKFCWQCPDVAHLREMKLMQSVALRRNAGSREETQHLLQEWKSCTARLESLDEPGEAREIARNQRAIEILEMRIELVDRTDLGSILDRARRCEKLCDDNGTELLICRELICEILMDMGSFVEAADLALESLQSMSACSPSENIEFHPLLAAGLRSLFAVGDYATIGALNESGRSGSLEVQLDRSGMLNFWSAFATIQQGRWPLARNFLDEARAELACHDPDGLYPLAEALYGFQESQTEGATFGGGQDRRENLIEHGNGRVENTDVLMLATGYRQLSRSPKEPEAMVALIERARAEKRSQTEHHLLILLWKMSNGLRDRPRALDRLERLSSEGVGRRCGTLAAAMGMVRSGQLVDIVGAAELMFSCGETCLGAELLASCLRGHSDGIDERKRGVLLRQLASWVTELGGQSWGALSETMNERGVTNREKEIIELVGQGKSNREIAQSLTVSQRTVEGHLYRIFAKLGISGRAELGNLG
ncbi:helix-turn-helix transcriptional regulator [Paeniglutamicibacter sulfureus]|uniref:DNA-binding CsgD family transcriptional regulator n=1 Tax=Paeniglutamicibacter sulfureus TaxID=43666 RepID=A0ABU2BGZ4_9MICC|nr:helix-turn-helix transcriptional regulator [Paeniglutamicibacter sulfureus]MDR7357506.1 DNA-binding CsgD family transcriptional regulator [Paeniglutamicibacter sulfureus]